MALTPLDIHNKEFPKKLVGGYDREAVEEFLNQVIRDMESLIKENIHLKEQAAHVTDKLEQYRVLEDTINRTLVVAQEAAEEIKSNARREADLAIQEARLQAERIIEAGQVKSRRLMEENADLARVIQVLRTQVTSLLHAQLQALGEVPNPFAQAAAGLMPGDKPKEIGRSDV